MEVEPSGPIDKSCSPLPLQPPISNPARPPTQRTLQRLTFTQTEPGAQATPPPRSNINGDNESKSLKSKERVDWSYLLSAAVGTGTSDDDIMRSGGEYVDREGGRSGNGEAEGKRFDLGTSGEEDGGRKAWYVPNEKTVFPVKKGIWRPSVQVADSVKGKGVREEENVASWEEEERAVVCGGGGMLWGVTERQVERAISGSGGGSVGIRGKTPRLRTRRSLEEEILRIEDDEIRRLTAIAYLS